MKTLRQHRLERALSIRDLAKAAGVSHQTVIAAESGKPLRLVSIRKIAKALGVQPMEIAEFARLLQDGE